MVDALLASVITVVAGCVATAVATVLTRFFLPRIWECITSCFSSIWSGLKWCFFKIFPEQCFKLDKNDQQEDQKKDLEEGLLRNGQAKNVKTNDVQGQSSSGGQAIHGHAHAGPSREGQSSGGLMFLAEDLKIEHRDNKERWVWPVEFPDEPRFKKAARLRNITWLEIKATIEVRILSPNTRYAAYLIFNTTKNSEGLGLIQDAYVVVGKDQYLSTKKVCLKPTSDTPDDIPYESPGEWSNNWMELKLDEFNTNDVSRYNEVVIKITEVDRDEEKTGLIVAGMQLRPIKP